jgi:hypothetical protein
MRPRLVCLLAVILTLASAEERKVLRLRPAVAPIMLDGSIEPAWFHADSTSDFVQHSPYWGKTPSFRTVARVLTTSEALYCLIVAYAPPERVQVNTGTLDNASGDMVSLMLDTFGDRQTAYKFAVTAAGVRSDARMLDDARNRDYAWDGVWFSEVRRHEWGFIVEMEIPYRTLQYDETQVEWGLDFDRWIPNGSEDLYWCVYEENEGQRISKFGRLMFAGMRPAVKGHNLELYPVVINKSEMVRSGIYRNRPAAGIDVFYNPSPQLTLQATANPDFAQIEADPFEFNISRYETYFAERRPFFTQGNEIFMASGRQRNTGFYRPLELLYTRRIGKKLPDGSEVPLLVGTKAFGRLESWEYGGFMAFTDARSYATGGGIVTEPAASFGAARIKRQIFENSSIGMLAVVKQDASGSNGVVDIDGAFRASDWQLAYQLAHSFRGNAGDVAASAGFMRSSEGYMILSRLRHVGPEFDVSQVGYVPWLGTTEFVGLGGPRLYFEDGAVRSILLYVGGGIYHERVDRYTDRFALIGYNMQFRSNWGFEINIDGGRSKDLDREYDSYSINLSSWFSISPTWNGNVWGGVQRTYNFARNYLAFYSWGGIQAEWKVSTTVGLGGTMNGFVEGDPSGGVEDVTLNSRPFVTVTPVNHLNVRLYVDNVYVWSSDRLEGITAGLLFSYNFLPKSWVYLAINEAQDRSAESDPAGVPLPRRMHTTARAAVLKVKYLHYF